LLEQKPHKNQRELQVLDLALPEHQQQRDYLSIDTVAW